MIYLYERLVNKWFCIGAYPAPESAQKERRRLVLLTGREYVIKGDNNGMD
jgi:hypothetical protein